MHTWKHSMIILHWDQIANNLLYVGHSLQDFGDYADSYYAVQTTEGEQIAQLISGYIDIILKKVCQLSIEILT